MSGNCGNMVAHTPKYQFPVCRPTVIGEKPVRTLLVPDQGVTIHRQPVGMGHRYESVGLGEVEAILRWMQR